MIGNRSIPYDCGNCDAMGCLVCKLTHPKKRNVPKIDERSGSVLIQIDYMPMGCEEKGWKGETGTYVFSSRHSKLVKT